MTKYDLSDIKKLLEGKNIKTVSYPQDNPDSNPFEMQLELGTGERLSVFAEGDGGFCGTLGFSIYEAPNQNYDVYVDVKKELDHYKKTLKEVLHLDKKHGSTSMGCEVKEEGCVDCNAAEHTPVTINSIGLTKEAKIELAKKSAVESIRSECKKIINEKAKK